ncbi:BFO_1060 family glycosyltransferase [Rosettibacter firmus]|uniref:BFO_1060 family glycosyltransferase n=1 Tax=Rosettibacter firmus TaxID=3111522 RepID=UPI00336C29C3
MNRKIRVLCFTDLATGRDVEMILPIRFFAEKFLNCEFYHALNIDIHKIFIIKPDIILLPNTIGSNLYFEISKIAHQQSIPLFALISEGNFRTDGSFNIWGFNKDKKFYQEFICCWSQRTAEYLKKIVPEYKDRIVVTGGVGFDRYVIYQFMTKENFLKKYKKEEYKKVIGYAGWAFGKKDHKRGREELISFFKGDHSKLQWVEEQRIKVREILRSLIESNPDILFILKQHPQENAPERPEPVINEMCELVNYPNVLYLCNEESIHDLISVSDIWTCFESTTALESWLMGKQTIFINPDPDFNRDLIYKGSALAKNYNEIQEMISQFYNKGKIDEFFYEDKIKMRNQLINDIIGFGDGFNHIRASLYLKKTIDHYLEGKYNPTYKFHFWHWLVYILIRIAGPFYNKKLYSHIYKLKKHLWVFEDYKMDKLYQLYERYKIFLDKFYQIKNIDEKYIAGELLKNI